MFKNLLNALCSRYFKQKPLDTFVFTLYLSPENKGSWPKALADLDALLCLTSGAGLDAHLDIACASAPWCSCISGKCPVENIYSVASWAFAHNFTVDRTRLNG